MWSEDEEREKARRQRFTRDFAEFHKVPSMVDPFATAPPLPGNALDSLVKNSASTDECDSELRAKR